MSTPRNPAKPDSAEREPSERDTADRPGPAKPGAADRDPVKPDPVKRDLATADPIPRDPAKHNPVTAGPAPRDPVTADPAERGPAKRDPATARPTERGPAKRDPATARPTERGPAKRDPEGRRRALAAAAVEVIAEVGIGRTTHRAVAARAGVPLGATTYYFPTLADLVEAGLRQVTEATRAELAGWAAELTRENLAPTLARLAATYLADRPRALLEYELCVAAARDERLRPLLLAWLDGLDGLITPLTDAATARAVAMLLDGAMLQAVATGRDLDEPALRDAIMQLTR